MTGWTIRTIHDKECDRDNYWVLTAHMKSTNVNGMFIDPVYMTRKGYTDIKWIGMDVLGSWETLEQAECYIKELGGTIKLGNGYITDIDYKNIYSV